MQKPDPEVRRKTYSFAPRRHEEKIEKEVSGGFPVLEHLIDVRFPLCVVSALYLRRTSRLDGRGITSGIWRKVRAPLGEVLRNAKAG